jgi:uncharacterized 2Fe-2S/4Fe-4S cluster protein (DUF4445 family)
MPEHYTIVFQPVGRHITLDTGRTLLDAAHAAGVEIISLCGGIGACESCRVRLVSGQLTPPTMNEEGQFRPAELRAGWRLACQVEPLSDVTIDIPPESLSTPQRLQIEGDRLVCALAPAVTAVDVSLPEPALDDLRADTVRLRDAIGQPVELSLPVIRQLAQTLRQHGWQSRLAVHSGRAIAAALPPQTLLLGLAVDVGTTSIAAYLIDLASGESLSKAGAMNPQIAYGEDVISRIAAINEEPYKAQVLQQRLISTINDLIAELCQDAEMHPSQIVDMVVVGNTAMHHIFAGLPVRSLGEAPYVAVAGNALEFPASEVGIDAAPGAQIYIPPVIAGYVGADHLAVLLAVGLMDTLQTVIAIDIGTNTEITIAHGGQLWSCSTASGPAFEGAYIRDGMRAAPGAIERVSMLDGQLRIQTIGGQAPVGICGSGILDAVAVMVKAGVVDWRGSLNSSHRLVETYHGEIGFVLASDGIRPIMVTRQDVATIQLAKSAIRAGIEILIDAAGITAANLEKFIIAGAFGTYINVESAVQIGMFPAIPLERFKQVGNAAGMGAWQLLINAKDRERIAVPAVHYVELTAHSGFQDQFMQQMNLGA